MRYLSIFTLFSATLILSPDCAVSEPTRLLKLERGHLLPSPEGSFAVASAPGIEPYLISTETGKAQARFDVPQEVSGYCHAFSPDASTIAGVFADGRGNDTLLVWKDSGKLLHSVPIPDAALYVMSLRFSKSGRFVYAGARTGVYSYDTQEKHLSILDSKTHYVLDIAVHPDDDRISYSGKQAEFGLYECKRTTAPESCRRLELTWDRRPRLFNSTDYAADGSEIVVSAVTQEEDGQEQTQIIRVNLLSGNEVSRAITRHRIEKVRYVDDTKLLLIWGQGAVDSGGFGFIGYHSTEVNSWHEVKSSIAGVAVNRRKTPHVTVGLKNGTLMQWLKEDWPVSWNSLLGPQ